MTHEPGSKLRERHADVDVFDPELMSWMLEAARKNLQSIERRNDLAGKKWIRNDPDKTSLCHGAGRPAVTGVQRKPSLHLRMPLMRRPKQRNQHVNVEQVTHGKSASSRFTSSDETVSASSGASKTTRPFTVRVFKGALRPRRTSSETALPIASDRF